MWFMICCNLVGMDYMICVSIHINDEIEYIYIYFEIFTSKFWHMYICVTEPDLAFIDHVSD